MNPLLKVENLHVHFDSYAGAVHAVRGVSFTVEKGEVLAIVGESGCGKTVTAKAAMRLLDRTNGRVDPASRIELEGQDMLHMPRRKLNTLRGKDISMIFQDSMTSLNPTMTVGKQIMENLLTHTSMTKGEARKRAKELLERTVLTISEIAIETGYSNTAYFTKMFKKYTNGVTPREYRKGLGG